MEICIIEISKKTIAKNGKSIFSKTAKQKKQKNDSRHNSGTEKCRALFKYENKSKIG